jgi:hypothetical protein
MMFAWFFLPLNSICTWDWWTDKHVISIL